MRGARTAIDAASADNPLAVLQIDIDHFKSINDRFGHDVGDLVIRCVSGVLRESAALAGRLGGEEFALLLPGQNLGGAAVLAHRIRSRCAETAVPGQMEDLRFTVSVGLSEWSEGDDIDTLLKRADLALYAAKKAGRNRVAATTTALRTEFVA